MSTGWPAVRSTCAELEIGFDGWQDGAGRLILAKRRDGLYAADTIVISIPRQVGKTYLIGAIVFALCLLFPGLLVVWTSHRSRTTGETFRSMKGMAKRKKVAPHILQVFNGNGSESIEFRNGSRVLFGAREHGFGLGFAGVGVLVLDEFQRITPKAMDDLIPTTNTAPNPLILCTGTPPRPTDAGETFSLVRTAALEGESDDTLYIEISADPEADAADRAQWRKANPSYPHRTPERAILRMLKNLSPDSFRREGLGIWDETAHKPVLTRPAWDALEAKGQLPDVAATALGIDANPKGDFFAAGCWLDGEDAHVELLPLPTDLVQAADLIAARCGRRIPVLIHSSSPAKVLEPLLRARKVTVKFTAGPDMATACVGLLRDMTEGRLTHGGQKILTASLMAARKKAYGDAGAWVWDFTTEGVAPTVAVTLARFGAGTRKRRSTQASSGERRAVVL